MTVLEAVAFDVKSRACYITFRTHRVLVNTNSTRVLLLILVALHVEVGVLVLVDHVTFLFI